ncbi:flavin reductase family protein [Streptomyces caniscabiei]|uniref:Flavin reductase family protein n=1 Tax=Streptomyces caniscabiei TaxID=2746961 RepID=A0ABU4N5H0_9ACTN|nr:flavin reductase family protein [Streptomyces caniscabiei]MBE4733351.1 flavin reductase family protein [Streptomyces caniscabiei]MBE4754529.1 flavin reductase family protein [Streptomyces caniscabiei]MBE4768650.1 flavin reductase family protein [Streptomyces caniscabiei]MBE4781846.1 flavin reductase family protein [Streptomyces caniscabiei]MBE4793136.1 flavin reductase family protein [Streptomyces caniscabiei]
MTCPSQPSTAASARRFRDAMAAVASPVAVVTAMDGHRPHGTTVSAFASLSLTPPMVLVSLDNRSRLLAIVRRTGRFGLNILGTHQAALAAAFTRPGGDKFYDVIWSPSADLPRLPGSAAWITAEVDEYVTAGDHTVLLAHVHAAEPGTEGPEPLTYHQRSFGTHTPLTTHR